MSLLDDAILEEVIPDITEEKALEYAVIAWTFEETMNIKFDPILAKAFADIISAIINGGFISPEEFNEFVEQVKEALGEYE
ncbi:hypothetical protein LCGC14_1322540 [marine sediment metagenome]|uniref:Uncharacterized protein n=1 Tax=marine sediment metagenome TaxID=412755 RepID=A0A0F9KJ28_9ZZZZ